MPAPPATSNLFAPRAGGPPDHHLIAYSDGGARGNPGPSGYGVVIQDQSGKKIAALSEYLGHQTNNFAEYQGLIAALEYAVKHGHKALKVISDSELLVRQIKGIYKVKNAALKDLHARAKELIAQLDWFSIGHVLRGHNQEADELANAAMDKGMGRVSRDRLAARVKEKGSMADGGRKHNDMPDVPKLDFIGALCELWFGISYAAYHLAYVRVYLNTIALQTHIDQLKKEEQDFRNKTQVDVLICRAHLAGFFWQLEHFFELLRIAIRRARKEQPDEKYFLSYEKKLEELEQTAIRQEINAYRNKGHEITAIIGCSWEQESNKFRHHFLPTIEGFEPKESIDMNTQLQKYFEFVANVWLSFAPSELKDKFPRDFRFPVTVPNSFLGELPAELKGGAPQLEVHFVPELKEP
jgi:ribonuclease HI